MRIPFDDLEETLRFKPLWSSTKLLKAAVDHWKAWQSALQSKPAAVPAALRTFRPKVRIYLSHYPYLIKTVESSWELESALRLRTRVFHEELLGRPPSDRLDTDAFDLACDHLVIIDQRSSQCVGTYRLICSMYAKRFYSATEFDIADLLALQGVKLELGRACIDKNYRTGRVIALLWSGITQYARQVNARYLFGCASVHSLDPKAISAIREHLRERGSLDDTLALTPHHPMEKVAVDSADAASARKLIPPLLQSYLRMGAKVGAEPAVDAAFHCVDFLTVLDLNHLAASYERKFVSPC